MKSRCQKKKVNTPVGSLGTGFSRETFREEELSGHPPKDTEVAEVSKARGGINQLFPRVPQGGDEFPRAFLLPGKHGEGTS